MDKWITNSIVAKLLYVDSIRVTHNKYKVSPQNNLARE